MSGLKGAECRKFQANIFNKSKCTNCFKQREEHSPEALESNRVSVISGSKEREDVAEQGIYFSNKYE